MSFNPADYEIESVIGEGGFALVQKYKHRTFDEKIAVKKLKQDTRDELDNQERLRREINLLELLQVVPGVIKLLGLQEIPTMQRCGMLWSLLP